LKPPKLFKTCAGKATGEKCRWGQRGSRASDPCLPLHYGSRSENTRCLNVVPYLHKGWARPQQKKFGACFQKAHASSVGLAQPGGHRAQYGFHTHGTPSTYISVSAHCVICKHDSYLYVQEATSVFFPISSFWAKSSRTWIRRHRTRKRNLLLLLGACASVLPL